MAATTIKEGITVWVRCKAGEGQMPSEWFISFTLPSSRDVKAFVPKEDVRVTGKKAEVRAVVARVENGSAAILFRGEVFGATNPVLVPRAWLSQQSDSQRSVPA